MTPIAVIAYRRPDHLAKCLLQLSACPEAKLSDLHIFLDGPRSTADTEACHATLQIAEKAIGFRSIEIHCRTSNAGLAKNITEAVDKICESNDRVIVVEDDVVVSPAFLTYMNQALALYSENSNVWHISGYQYPIPTDGLPPTFFLRLGTCWGWGTWRRAWNQRCSDPKGLLDRIRSRSREFNLGGTYDFLLQLEDNAAGRIKTWAILWYASIFLAEGLSLHPATSLTANIGFDNSGENSGVRKEYELIPANAAPVMHKLHAEIDGVATRRLGRWFSATHPHPQWTRFRRKLYQIRIALGIKRKGKRVS